MATTTQIRVTAVDNELYLLASQEPCTSSELCHIKSGDGRAVDVTIVPQSVLPAGSYTLIMIGINWGEEQAFSVTVTTGGVDKAYTAPPSTAIGANWTVAVPITV